MRWVLQLMPGVRIVKSTRLPAHGIRAVEVRVGEREKAGGVFLEGVKDGVRLHKVEDPPWGQEPGDDPGPLVEIA